MEITDEFIDEDGNLQYTLVKEFIPRMLAQQMSEYIKARIAAGKNHVDDQCPKSLSVSGGFNKLQVQYGEKMTELFGKYTDKKLFLAATYNYARQYAPGDELKVHKDRASCEYSATISLGREGGDIWPFYAQYKDNPKSEIRMEVGDAVIYKGCDVDHWREINEFGVQYQAFFHYVDLYGPNKSWVYDKKKDKFMGGKKLSEHICLTT